MHALRAVLDDPAGLVPRLERHLADLLRGEIDGDDAIAIRISDDGGRAVARDDDARGSERRRRDVLRDRRPEVRSWRRPGHRRRRVVAGTSIGSGTRPGWLLLVRIGERPAMWCSEAVTCNGGRSNGDDERRRQGSTTTARGHAAPWASRAPFDISRRCPVEDVTGKARAAQPGMRRMQPLHAPRDRGRSPSTRHARSARHG